MRVHNQPEYAHLLSEKQWAEQGRVLNENAVGEKMWTNHYCCFAQMYYDISATRKGTPEEMKLIKEKKREKSKKYREKKRNIEKQYILDLQNEINRLQLDYDIAVKAYKKVTVNIAKMLSDTDNTNSVDIVVIDTETTGLDCYRDELLQVSIIDIHGNTLYNQHIKPIATSWKKAEKVNGISPDMVKNCPPVYEEIPKINAILHNAKTIVGYNTSFDLNFLSECGCILPEDCKIVDVMQEFAEIYGEWSEYYGNWKWQSLVTCANYYNYDWGGETAHDSLADCKATLFCYNSIKTAP